MTEQRSFFDLMKYTGAYKVPKFDIIKLQSQNYICGIWYFRALL